MALDIACTRSRHFIVGNFKMDNFICFIKYRRCSMTIVNYEILVFSHIVIVELFIINCPSKICYFKNLIVRQSNFLNRTAKKKTQNLTLDLISNYATIITVDEQTIAMTQFNVYSYDQKARNIYIYHTAVMYLYYGYIYIFTQVNPNQQVVFTNYNLLHALWKHQF